MHQVLQNKEEAGGGHAQGYEDGDAPETGQKGTKRLVAQYGDRLVCVRYRHDVKRGVRLKTVEIVVEEKPLTMAGRYRDGDLVAVVVAYGEKELRDRLKASGGRWDPQEKLWRVPFGAIRGDGELEGRIVEV